MLNSSLRSSRQSIKARHTCTESRSDTDIGLWFCYEKAVCVGFGGERPRLSGRSFSGDRAWTHPLRSMLSGAAGLLCRRVLGLSWGAPRAGLWMLHVLHADERRVLWRLHSSLRRWPALCPETRRHTAAALADPRTRRLHWGRPDARCLSHQSEQYSDFNTIKTILWLRIYHLNRFW